LSVQTHGRPLVRKYMRWRAYACPHAPTYTCTHALTFSREMIIITKSMHHTNVVTVKSDIGINQMECSNSLQAKVI